MFNISYSIQNKKKPTSNADSTSTINYQFSKDFFSNGSITHMIYLTMNKSFMQRIYYVDIVKKTCTACVIEKLFHANGI
jgi:hypothetical protein